MEDSENVSNSDYDDHNVINYFLQLFLSEVHYEDRTQNSQININNPEYYTLPYTLFRVSSTSTCPCEKVTKQKYIEQFQF